MSTPLIAAYYPNRLYLDPRRPIDGIVSAVWTQRWQGYGEAVIVLPPNAVVNVGDLIALPPRDGVMEVVRMERTQRAVTLRCKDALAMLDWRVISPAVANDGLVSTFITKMVSQDGVLRTQGSAETLRTIGPVWLGDLSAIQGSAAIQRSNRPMGEVLLELGRAYGFDPRMRLGADPSDRLVLRLDAHTPSGATRTWGVGRGLSGWRRDDDEQSWRNVAVVGGQEEDGERVTAFAWTGSREPEYTRRREEFIDRRDVPIGGMDRASVVEQYGDLASCGALTATTVTSGASAPYSVEDVRMTVEMTAGGVAVTASALLRDVLSESAWASCAADCSTSAVSKTYTRKA